MTTKINYIEMKGTPFNRGQTYGETLKAEIWEAFERTMYQTKQDGIDFDPIVDDFLESTQYLSAVEKWTPNLLQEVKGIAKGAGIDFDILF
ncbi:MAG: hypothetical protein KAR20_29315, partial [Candidatus Heimdallarchaeota archaeon]|nr:hypothetical protein [Candidatus Heimdallarchaeota archaeon]